MRGRRCQVYVETAAEGPLTGPSSAPESGDDFQCTPSDAFAQRGGWSGRTPVVAGVMQPPPLGTGAGEGMVQAEGMVELEGAGAQ